MDIATIKTQLNARLEALDVAKKGKDGLEWLQADQAKDLSSFIKGTLSKIDDLEFLVSLGAKNPKTAEKRASLVEKISDRVENIETRATTTAVDHYQGKTKKVHKRILSGKATLNLLHKHGDKAQLFRPLETATENRKERRLVENHESQLYVTGPRVEDEEGVSIPCTDGEGQKTLIACFTKVKGKLTLSVVEKS